MPSSKRKLAGKSQRAFSLRGPCTNCIGGDINGGAQDLGQLFFRPTASLRPYATSDPRIFLCSSSAPPGGGVHGMCGCHAACLALLRTRQIG